MKVLITGGAGYIGTELTRKLVQLEKVTEVIVYDNLDRPNYNLFIGKRFEGAEKIRFVKGELLNSRLLRTELKGVDIVYHLAAKVTTPFADQNPHLFEQVNHWGTAELVYAIESTESVKQLVYLSSSSVYGSGSTEVDIDTPLNPKTFYGISKMRGEEHVQRVSNKISTYIFRCGNVYGYSKSMRFDAVINLFTFQAQMGQKLRINGSGEQRRPFIQIQQAIKVLTETCTKNLSPGTYDLVEQNLSISDIYEALQSLYPELEMIFVNRHMKMRELVVKPNEQVISLMNERQSLKDDLKEFKETFAF